MESNWRWNVYASGAAPKQFDFVARLVTPIAGRYALGFNRFGSLGAFSIGTVDEQGWVGDWIFWSTTLNQPFPRFFNVVPDQPAVPWV